MKATAFLALCLGMACMAHGAKPACSSAAKLPTAGMLSTASNLTDDLLLKAVDAAGQRAITKASLSKCTVVNGTVPLKACAQKIEGKDVKATERGVSYEFIARVEFSCDNSTLNETSRILRFNAAAFVPEQGLVTVTKVWNLAVSGDAGSAACSAASKPPARGALNMTRNFEAEALVAAVEAGATEALAQVKLSECAVVEEAAPVMACSQVVNATAEESAGVRYEYSAKMTIECKAGAARTLRFDASAWAPAGGEVDVNVVKNVVLATPPKAPGASEAPGAPEEVPGAGTPPLKKDNAAQGAGQSAAGLVLLAASAAYLLL